MEEEKNQTPQESGKPGTKAPLIIIIFMLLLFLTGIAYMYFFRNNAGQVTDLTATPAEEENGMMEETTPTEGESMMEDEGVMEEVSPTPTVKPTSTPTTGPSPTSSGPGGLQSNPTSTPKPTNLPLTY